MYAAARILEMPKNENVPYDPTEDGFVFQNAKSNRLSGVEPALIRPMAQPGSPSRADPLVRAGPLDPPFIRRIQRRENYGRCRYLAAAPTECSRRLKSPARRVSANCLGADSCSAR